LAKRIDVLSPRMIGMIEDLDGDWRRLDERVERVTEEIEQLAHGSESCQQLMTVPGIVRSSQVRWLRPLPTALPLPKDATLPPGSASCRSKGRPVIGRSLGTSASAVIAIYAHCSYRAPG